MKKLLTHKKIIIFLIVFIVALTFFMLNQNKEEPQVSANVISLEKKTIEQIISVKSPLEGIEKAEVVSPLNYEIIDIRVKEGDIVSKDQILAVLDSDDLQKEIASFENQIALTKLEQQDRLNKTQIEYDKAIISLEELEKSYDQNKELFENDIITEDAFRKIENSLTEAKKSLESYNAVDGKIVLTPSEKKDIEIKEQELNQKKEDLEKVYIKSPIDGTVTRVNVNLGRYAKDTEDEKAMFIVENLEKLQMKVSISEFDINKIKTEQEVDIYSDVLSANSAKGMVSRISPTAEQKEANSMERVIPVLIDVTEKPENLIAGVLATAKIKVAKAENVFAVPSGSLVQDENFSYKIYILNEDNSLKSIPVEIGLETDLETEIKSAELTAGMKVVVNPDITFTDGTVVTPNEVE
nr:efflux RND transporter periplasmic adaptor subunit [Sedimentibacter sp.]